jgi:hypothetical protein
MFQDGSGAQIQRILSIRAISNYLGFNFFNSEILDMDFNPGDGIDSLEKKRGFLMELNSFIFFQNSCGNSHVNLKSIPEGRITASLNRLTLFLKIASIWSALSRKHIHFLVSSPERWIKIRPEILECLDFQPFDANSTDTPDSFLISVHIQRAKNTKSQLSDRYQPTSWYKKLLDEVTGTLEAQGANYRIDLHTDAPEHSQKWRLGNAVSSRTVNYWKRGGFIDDTGIANLGTEDFYTSLGYSSEVMQIHREINSLDAWKLMSKSDVIITGRSSFSYIGALLNKGALVLSPKYFNSALNSWLVIQDEPSSKDLFALGERVKRCLL